MTWRLLEIIDESWDMFGASILFESIRYSPMVSISIPIFFYFSCFFTFVILIFE